MFAEGLKGKTIKRDTLHITDIRNSFPVDRIFSIDDLRELYRRADMFANDNTIKSRIHHLVKMGVIRRVGRGRYMLGEEVFFIPTISPKNRSVYNYIKRDYPMLNVCLWHTSILNHFMVHQPARFSLIIEVERYGEESIFYHLKEKFRDVFLNPTEEIYFNYIAEKRESIIVTTLVSEAPLQAPSNVPVPTLEKILVDIFCDELIFSAQQGQEMDHIWRNALDNYTVNFSTLLRYAARRGRKREIDHYLRQITDYWR
jgi:hypothetical protein